jgi:hypothetical protein
LYKENNNNNNLHAKYAEKLAKYSDFSIEIKDQWKMDSHNNSSYLINKWDYTQNITQSLKHTQVSTQTHL